MWSSEGPSGFVWRATSMGMLGLRYFILGSISRQNLLCRIENISFASQVFLLVAASCSLSLFLSLQWIV
jgi:hypothetical protein